MSLNYMPLRLEIVKKLSARSERVKSVDFHPVEPWILCGLYSGHIFIWNYITQQMIKSLEVSELPVRTAKFIPSKHWIAVGSDDMYIRIFNYNTLERVKMFEAHTDYIRCIAVHPTLPLILSSSDDMLIKLWDYDKDFQNIQIFEGHTHYVMAIEFNPKDGNTFASASLDRSIKIWGLNAPTPHFSLDGHERGVNCVSYFRGGDRPYIISGADDHLVKVWDYQTKTCVATLDGHTNNISSVVFHPNLPIILSGSEDGTVRVWHGTTYRLENTLNYGMERVWTLACLKSSNKVAIGYDDGTIMIKIGHEEPVVSMDTSGKVVYAKNQEIIQAALRKEQIDSIEPVDGERLPITTKELGSCEIYPQYIQHAPNGRLIVACGDGEFIIYTALSLKNKSFGQALEFVWGDSDDKATPYATRESNSKIVIYRNFKEYKTYKPAFAAESIFGGPLLGVRSNEFIDFIDWSELRTIRRIDVCPKKVYWSESGDVVVLACDTSMYILRYNSQLVDRWLAQGLEVPEQGIEGSFELDTEINEKVKAGFFTGDCFIYVNSQNRLNYYIGGETQTLAHLEKPMYLLGYLTAHNRVYLIDKQHNIYSYQLLLDVLIYQTAIVRQDYELAANTLTKIPVEQHNKLAHFLESHDLRELALEVSRDDEHRFELAMAIENYELAHQIALAVESQHKWKTLGDAALKLMNMKLAIDCYTRAKDLGGLLLLYTTLGDATGIQKLAALAKSESKYNITFLCYFLLNRPLDCVNLLIDNKRIPEAGYFARTYIPSEITRICKLWKQDLQTVSTTAADALANPTDNPELFDDYDLALQAESILHDQPLKSASEYMLYADAINRDIVAEIRDGTLQLNATHTNTKKSTTNEHKYNEHTEYEHKRSPTDYYDNKQQDDILKSDDLQHVKEEPVDPFASIMTPVVSETIDDKPTLPTQTTKSPTVQSVTKQLDTFDFSQSTSPTQQQFYPPAAHNSAQQQTTSPVPKPTVSPIPPAKSIPTASVVSPNKPTQPIATAQPITVTPAKPVVPPVAAQPFKPITTTNAIATPITSTATTKPVTANVVNTAPVPSNSEIDDFDMDEFDSAIPTNGNSTTTADDLNKSLKDLEDEIDFE